jgi:hypothetical protein
MKIALAVFLFINSFVHFTGFIVFWRNVQRNINQRYRRVFLRKDPTMERIGFRVIAILYFLTALAFFLFGIEILTGFNLFWNNIWRVTILSLIFCIIGWPRAKLGVIANTILILFLIMNSYHSWVG